MFTNTILILIYLCIYTHIYFTIKVNPLYFNIHIYIYLMERRDIVTQMVDWSKRAFHFFPYSGSLHPFQNAYLGPFRLFLYFELIFYIILIW